MGRTDKRSDKPKSNATKAQPDSSAGIPPGGVCAVQVDLHDGTVVNLAERTEWLHPDGQPSTASLLGDRISLDIALATKVRFVLGRLSRQPLRLHGRHADADAARGLQVAAVALEVTQPMGAKREVVFARADSFRSGDT